MALSHRDRFRLKNQVVTALSADDWSFERRNLLFSEFGLPQMGGWEGPSIADVLVGASDSVLIEIYGTVLEVDTREVVEVVETGDRSDNWRAGYVRLFLSHSALHKAFVGQVAEELAVVGIHAFVAHDAMEYSKPWQEQIEQALRSMQAFTAIVHPEFLDSAWCQQEVGWALGRRVPQFAIRIGIDPAGFIGREQWPSGANRSPSEVADVIYRWVASVPELGPSIIEGLFDALAHVGNYVSAGAAAGRIAALGTLSEADFERLDEIWWCNNQLHGGLLPTREMQPFYERNGRPWPPPKKPDTSL